MAKEICPAAIALGTAKTRWQKPRVRRPSEQRAARRPPCATCLALNQLTEALVETVFIGVTLRLSLQLRRAEAIEEGKNRNEKSGEKGCIPH